MGALDFLLRRRQHKRSLWRTRQEADRERREEEGDSTHAAARRRLHDELSHAAALDAAKSARLVIAGKGNAIALAYDAGVDPAPRALVCGRGWHALTVMRLAEEAGVAIADDATLAVELIETPPGGFIPESTYPPVAEWLRRTERGS